MNSFGSSKSGGKVFTLALFAMAMLLCFASSSMAIEIETLLFEDWESYQVGDFPGAPWQLVPPSAQFIYISEMMSSNFLEVTADKIEWEPETPITTGYIELSMDVVCTENSDQYFYVYNYRSEIGILLKIDCFFFDDTMTIWSLESDNELICGQTILGLQANITLSIVMENNVRKNRYTVHVNNGYPTCQDIPIQVPGWWDEDDLPHPPIRDLATFQISHIPGNSIFYDNLSVTCQDCQYGYPHYDDDDDDDNDDNNDDDDNDDNNDTADEVLENDEKPINDSDDSCCG